MIITWLPYSILIGQECVGQKIKACVVPLAVLFFTKINKLAFWLHTLVPICLVNENLFGIYLLCKWIKFSYRTSTAEVYKTEGIMKQQAMPNMLLWSTKTHIRFCYKNKLHSKEIIIKVTVAKL